MSKKKIVEKLQKNKQLWKYDLNFVHTARFKLEFVF